MVYNTLPLLGECQEVLLLVERLGLAIQKTEAWTSEQSVCTQSTGRLSWACLVQPKPRRNRRVFFLKNAQCLHLHTNRILALTPLSLFTSLYLKSVYKYFSRLSTTVHIPCQIKSLVHDLLLYFVHIKKNPFNSHVFLCFYISILQYSLCFPYKILHMSEISTWQVNSLLNPHLHHWSALKAIFSLLFCHVPLESDATWTWLHRPCGRSHQMALWEVSREGKGWEREKEREDEDAWRRWKPLCE